jgi:hypothetical protein
VVLIGRNLLKLVDWAGTAEVRVPHADGHAGEMREQSPESVPGLAGRSAHADAGHAQDGCRKPIRRHMGRVAKEQSVSTQRESPSSKWHRRACPELHTPIGAAGQESNVHKEKMKKE